MRSLLLRGTGLLGVVVAIGCARSGRPNPIASEHKDEVTAPAVVVPTPTPTPIEAEPEAEPELAPVIEITGGLSTPPVVLGEPAAPVVLGACDLRATIKTSGPARSRRYVLTLKNEGTQTLSLVVPGDGSEVGWRAPVLEWSATSGGKPVEQLEAPGCGMMNAIQPDEIFTLAPGASKSMTDWIHGPTYAPGTYQVRLRYTNDPKRAFAKVTATPEVVAKLTASSACDVISEPLTLNVP